MPSNVMKGCCWKVTGCAVFSVLSVKSRNFLCTTISILENIFAELLISWSSAFIVAASASYKSMTMYSSCAT